MNLKVKEYIIIYKMPKTAMDYSKCCIYKIEHIENESLVYVGHTTNFNKRKGQHKSICMNENVRAFNFKLYQMIRDNGGWDRFKMIEVEKYPCKDKREAERREDEVMKELKASMNTYKSFTTEEYKKEYKKEYHKEYFETNKERLQEYKKEYNKKYREDNKEIITKKLKEKITCTCGCVVTTQNIKRHERNKKHINLIK